MSLNLPTEAFRLLCGELKGFTVVCDSGRAKHCTFCGSCGTRIYHDGEGGMSLKAGTLDDTSQLRPEVHYWTKRRQPWIDIPDEVERFADDG